MTHKGLKKNVFLKYYDRFNIVYRHNRLLRFYSLSSMLNTSDHEVKNTKQICSHRKIKML